MRQVLLCVTLVLAVLGVPGTAQAAPVTVVPG